MKILSQNFLRGPNIYAYRPCFVTVVDLEDLVDTPSTACPGIIETLTSLLPDLNDHHCSEGHAGGFLERLRLGTYPGHITEHVMIALQNMVGSRVHFGKTRHVVGTPTHYRIVVAYESEALVSAVLPVAVRLVESIFRGEPVSLTEDLPRLQDIYADTGLGPSTRMILEAARRRRVPVLCLSEAESIFQLGWGVHQKQIQATVTSQTSLIATDIAGDKDLTKQLLAEVALPVPQGKVVTTLEEARAAAASLGYPVVLKPLDGHQGEGITLNVMPAMLEDAFLHAQSYKRRVIVERHVSGRDYRLLVVGRKLVAAAWREPASVTGDGRHTIEELVRLENLNPLRGEGHMKPLTRISLDEAACRILARQGMTRTCVPPAGQRIWVKDNANLSSGGIAHDVTLKVHPSIARAAVRAARRIGLDVAGIDLVCEDISRPLADQPAAIVEINAAPGIRMHAGVVNADGLDAGGAIVESLMGHGNGRIPLFAITGTNGKTTVTRLIGHTLKQIGQTVGMTTTDGVYVDGEVIETGDCTGYWSARVVLTHPDVEVAVLEQARGGLIRRGLAFDESAVGIVLNVGEDHLGQDGMHTLDDIAWAKRLIAETTRCAVLNADDGRVCRMHEKVKAGAEVVYFSREATNPTVLAHLETGGRAVFLDKGVIVLGQGARREVVEEIGHIPFTLGGLAGFNVENALAATAALWVYGLSIDLIAAGLLSFQTDASGNPLRLNRLNVEDREVIVDYAHNYQAYEALFKLAQHLRSQRVVGVISAPGDRTDEALRCIGELSAEYLDEIILFELDEERGRQPGETMQLLEEGVRRARRQVPVRKVLQDLRAIDAAIESANPGDLILVGCAEHNMLEYVESLHERVTPWERMKQVAQ